jgi:hypothetical protein
MSVFLNLPVKVLGGRCQIPLFSYDPILPTPLHTVYVYTVYSIQYTVYSIQYTVYSIVSTVYSTLEPERRGEEQQFTKLGQLYQHDRLYLQSINYDKHLPQSPFTGLFF